MANPLTVLKSSPYAPAHYPSATHTDSPEVFEIGEGQHITGLEFTLRKLHPIPLHVRVTRPNGQPAEGVTIFVAYEHTFEYGASFAPSLASTDRNGLANIVVFGDAHIRLWAERQHRRRSSIEPNRDSRVFELDSGHLPETLHIMLSASEGERR